MKYIPEDTVIPTERRKEINEKIFHIIKNNVECDITKNDIFNSFTGKGGTHGLKFEDYRNYSEFRQAKNEVDYGQYFTKPSQVQFIYDVIKPTKDDILGDLTAGHGNFINSCPNEHNFYANELDLQAYTVAKHLYPDAKISNMDIQHYEPATFLSILFGNPPFNQNWGVRSEMYYCQKAAKVLRPAGLLVMIAPVAFCADEFSDKWMIKELNENFNYVCQIALDKNLFKHLGVEISTKLMVLQKKSEYLEDTEFKTEILDVTDSEFLHDTYIKPIMEVQRKLRAKLFNESIKENSLYEQQIKKLLFDIKRNQKTTNRLTECHELVNQFFTQTKPDYMKSDEWEKKKLTKEKVLQQLKDVLKSQNPVKPQLDRLIKDSYQIRYNGMVYQINDLVTGNEYPFEDKTLMGLINKKRRQYINQSRDFTKALVNKNEWLENFRLKTSKDIIKFNEIQQHDVNLFMQKKYGFMEYLFNSTGNSKKDAMLRLLHQLLLMLKICAAAQTIRPSIKETKKFEKVDQLATQHEHQRVAIGVRNKDVAQQYFNYIHSKHPERPIFLVTGEKYTVKQRKKICEIIANTENGIMISTQQSLSSSMNIDCIDICIIPQLHWNNEAMSQYYHRFIRFDSVNYKTVYYVTYKQSIEINLLKMVMCKTQLNLFMKNREVDEMEVYEIYGLAKELFDNLAYRHTDKEGRTQIRWGKQKIS